MKRELEIAQRTKIEMDQQMDKLIKERQLLHDKLDKASYPEDVRVRCSYLPLLRVFEEKGICSLKILYKKLRHITN